MHFPTANLEFLGFAAVAVEVEQTSSEVASYSHSAVEELAAEPLAVEAVAHLVVDPDYPPAAYSAAADTYQVYKPAAAAY